MYRMIVDLPKCYFITALFFLAIVVPVQATLVSISFSGTWSTDQGVIRAGDSFSGTATWDSNAIGANLSSPVSGVLTSLSFTMPSEDGLSLSSVDDPRILYATVTAFPPCAPDTCFDNVQFSETSTAPNADNNFYGFFLGTIPCSGPGPCDTFVDEGRTLFRAATYTVTGPTPVGAPEPGTCASILGGLGLLALRRWQNPSKHPRGPSKAGLKG